LISLFVFHIGFIEVSWIDIIDVSLVTILLYQLYKWMKGSIAEKIFLGVLSIYLVYLLVRALKMDLLTTILGQFIGVGVIAALILFQQEIRRFLLMVGKTTSFRDSLRRLFFWKKYSEEENELNLIPIIEAAKVLSETLTGGLIVFAKTSELKFYAESGDMLDAEISKRLLIAIFQKTSPLHDGAVIIASNRIKAARCILPVSDNDEIPANFGLRHRSAIGMTEVTDTVVLSVSEETGHVSIAYEGILYPNIAKTDLKEKLHYFLYEKLPEVKS
jgi:diadenylate cyclase